MDIQRIELKGGAWAMAHARPSHGQLKSIYKQAQANIKADRAEESLADSILVLVTEWHVPDGNGGSLTLNRQGINDAPNDIIQELSDAIERLTNKDTSTSDRLLAVAASLSEDDPIRAKVEALALEAVVPEENVRGN